MSVLVSIVLRVGKDMDMDMQIYEYAVTVAAISEDGAWQEVLSLIDSGQIVLFINPLATTAGSASCQTDAA